MSSSRLTKGKGLVFVHNGDDDDDNQCFNKATVSFISGLAKASR